MSGRLSRKLQNKLERGNARIMKMMTQKKRAQDGWLTVDDVLIIQGEYRIWQGTVIARWEARALARAMKPAAGSNGKRGRL